jgi:peroxiredoxin
MIVAMRLRRAGIVVAAALLTPGLGQRPALGEPAPRMPLVDLDGNRRVLSDLAGARGLVILFWATWSERSLAELTRLNESAGALREHGVTVAAVNVEHQNPSASDLAAVRTSVAKLELAVPVLVDEGLELFNAYGVITVPSTALVDPAGKLVLFAAGYAPGSREALFDAVDALAGQQKATPSVSLAAVPASALRKLQAGRLELANRRVEAARATFGALVESEPSFVEPVVELAALAIDDRDLIQADRLLARAFALQPDHAAATREQTRARFVGGQTADAVAALQRICARGDDPLADGYLGLVLAGTGRVEEATKWLERSNAAAGLDARQFLIDASDDGVAAAMAAYRRAATRQVMRIK